MAGLLDYLSSPQSMQLMGLASGLLEAGGPQRFPTGIGQGLGRGLLMGQQLGTGALQNQLQAQQLKVGEMTLAQKEMMAKLAAQLGGAQPDVAPVTGTPAAAGMSPATSMSAFGTPEFATAPVPQQQVAPAQAAGQRFPLNPQQMAALQLYGGPDLTGAYNAAQPSVEVKDGIMYDKKSGAVLGTIPTVNQQGFSTQLQPDGKGGWRVGVTPGGTEAYGTQLRTGEQTKAEYAPAKVMIGGRPVDTTQKIANALNTGQAPDEETAQAVRALMLRNGVLPGSGFSIGVGPQPGFGNPTGGGSPVAPNALVRNPFSNLPAGTAPNPAEQGAATAFGEAKAKTAAEDSVKFRTSWSEAQDRRANLDLLQHLFADPNVTAGAAADQITGLKGLAASAGIDIVGKSAEDVIRAVSGHLALKMKNEGGTNLMPGAMSDFEQKLLQNMTPSLSQSREGRMLLIEVMRAKLDKDQKIAEMAADYEEKHGVIDGGFYREARAWAKSNPIYSKERAEAMTELAKRYSRGR